MIFHTAAEIKYYNYFFKNWHRSLRKHWPDARFSLRFVGDASESDVVEYCKENSILLEVDSIDFGTMMERYRCLESDALGYYAMSRWISLPIINDHVCMTDVDIIQLNSLGFDLAADLESYDFISISRQKRNKTNKMMILFLNRDLVSTIRNKSMELLQSSPLVWNLDTQVLIWMVFDKKFRWREHTSLYCINDLSRIGSKVKFGYFSGLDGMINGVKYPKGTEAKLARYRSFLGTHPHIIS